MENENTKTDGVKPPFISQQPKSLPVFEDGVRTASQFATGMSLLMGDLISGRVTANIANSVCNAGGKMLKAIALQQKYGKAISHDGNDKDLKLID